MQIFLKAAGIPQTILSNLANNISYLLFWKPFIGFSRVSLGILYYFMLYTNVFYYSYLLALKLCSVMIFILQTFLVCIVFCSMYLLGTLTRTFIINGLTSGYFI